MQCCKAITDQEMKEIIDNALNMYFTQESGLPKVDHDSLSTALLVTQEAVSDPTTKEDERNELLILVNKLLIAIQGHMLSHLLHNTNNYESLLLQLQPLLVNCISEMKIDQTTLPFSYDMILHAPILNGHVDRFKKFIPDNFLTEWQGNPKKISLRLLQLQLKKVS